MQNFDSIICISNYALLNPGLQIARLLWSGTNDKLIMHVQNICKICLLSKELFLFITYCELPNAVYSFHLQCSESFSGGNR